MDHASLSIVIPAYNESGTIGTIISKLKAIAGSVQIIVVDDGSSDDTALIAARQGAHVISHPVNLGNGASVKRGIREANGEVLVVMDGDGQHDPGNIPTLISELVRFDMVVGARTKTQHASRPRRFMNTLFNRLASYVTGYPVQDLTSGFRAIRLHTAQDLLPLLPNGYSWPTTSTLVMLRSGFCVKYVPIDVQNRQTGLSRIRPFRDGIRFLMIILKICTLYSPFRIFLPVCGGMALLGLLNYAYTYFTFGRFTNMSALMFTGAIVIFMMGLLSEQISQVSLLRHWIRSPKDRSAQDAQSKQEDGHMN